MELMTRLVHPGNRRRSRFTGHSQVVYICPELEDYAALARMGPPARPGWPQTTRRGGGWPGLGTSMASITHLIRGTDGEYFEPSQRPGANVERAGELLGG